MYFPYLRGRQFELLALRDLVSKNLISDHVLPIVEPVKLSSTLVNTMDEFIKNNHVFSVIMNPAVGSFLSDYTDMVQNSKEAGYRGKFEELFQNKNILKSVLFQLSAPQQIEYWLNYNIAEQQDMLVIVTNRDWLDRYDRYFSDIPPKYVLIPDERIFRRKIQSNRVLLDDKFVKKIRNADYQDNTDEFFSDDHLYYSGENFIGFADYSIIGDEYSDSGFAPYAVAIHIVYFAPDKTLRVKHFVSDSNEDTSNPALKFYEAVSKLAHWYETEHPEIEVTFGLQSFLTHYENQTYPGLGTVKKLALMHHLELMSRYLDGEK